MPIDPNRYRSVVELLETAMDRYAKKIAFRCGGQSLTFADVAQKSQAFAAHLQSLGVKKGDRIALMMPNVLAFPLASIGILRAGAIQVNVNPLYTPRELEHQLKDSGAEMIVIHDAAIPTLEKAGAKVRAIRTAEVEEPPQARFEPPELGGDDLLFLQYTGGTTGVSKGAALSHRNLVANTEQFKAFMAGSLRPGEEVVVTALPLYHVFALMVNFLSYFSIGAENWLVPNPRDMDGFVELLRSARPTAFTGVNTLFNGLLMHPRIKEVDFSRLRLAIGGGAAVLPTTSAQWKAVTGRDIVEGYGLSETSPILTLNPNDGGAFSATVGLPLPSTQIKLLDADDREAKAGEPGEICARGPQVMGGYWQKPEANRAAFTGDGYFRTGDVGVFDGRGYLKIVDRKKDMILVSGFNVYPNEVEAIAAACPGVVECACVGAKDEKTGEAVRLYVVRAPGAAIAEQDVIAHCARELAGYKVPKQVRFLEALPKSAVGKILRKDLRAMA